MRSLTGRGLLLFCAGLLLLPGVGRASADRFAEARRQMVRAIEADVLQTASHINRKSLAPRVMEVMGKVARHRFVPPGAETWAYANRPLPIGHGQTISQPYIVALMTELAEVQAAMKVLEIGTGSGYQAAVLSPLVRKVCSIEIIPELGAAAADLLRDLNLASRAGYEALLEKIRERRNRVRSPFRSAEYFEIEEIIDPRETRPMLCDWLDVARTRLPHLLGPRRFGIRP